MSACDARLFGRCRLWCISRHDTGTVKRDTDARHQLSGSHCHSAPAAKCCILPTRLLPCRAASSSGALGSADFDWRLQRLLLSRPVDFGCNVPAELFPRSTAMTVVLNTRHVNRHRDARGERHRPGGQAKSRPRADAQARPRSHSHIFVAE